LTDPQLLPTPAGGPGCAAVRRSTWAVLTQIAGLPPSGLPPERSQSGPGQRAHTNSKRTNRAATLWQTAIAELGKRQAGYWTGPVLLVVVEPPAGIEPATPILTLDRRTSAVLSGIFAGHSVPQRPQLWDQLASITGSSALTHPLQGHSIDDPGRDHRANRLVHEQHRQQHREEPPTPLRHGKHSVRYVSGSCPFGTQPTRTRPLGVENVALAPS
jgi:hypothetical protein